LFSLYKSEDPADLDKLFNEASNLSQYCDEAGDLIWKELFDSMKGFAMRQKGTLEEFGRYPYRNEALGRKNTPEEELFLKERNVVK